MFDIDCPDGAHWQARRSGTVETDAKKPEAWERDRARIIHSFAFRRMQGKMQIFMSGENDYIRTRLTHSLEVAQIAGGIVSMLKKSGEKSEYIKWLPSQNLIESICLAHDIGHPPYGHGGERSLDYCHQQSSVGATCKGFEGNAQTLRIVCRLESHTRDYGLDLTRRTILGLIKYPICYSDALHKRPGRSRSMGAPTSVQGDWKPPKCIYDSDTAILDWAIEGLSNGDKDYFKETKPTTSEDWFKETSHKSLDCSIMDLADEISYAVHDLEDGLALGFVKRGGVLGSVAVEKMCDTIEPVLPGVVEGLFSVDGCLRKAAIGRLVHEMMKATEFVKAANSSHPLIALKCELRGKMKAIFDSIENVKDECIICHPAQRTLEWRGMEVVSRLTFAMFDTNNLVPPKCFDVKSPERSIVDFVSGMTDEYAVRWFERLFVPRTRTIFEPM